MVELLKPMLKAVVAAATPIILAGVNDLVNDAETLILGVVTSALTTVGVWLTPNKG